jgi:glyoxylase-like metal-dependent hydrolase (beta-lactamase superfamily II)
MKIAPRINRIGGNSTVNAHLVEEAGEVTIIDAGVPGYYDDIPRELAGMGRTVADIRAHAGERSAAGAPVDALFVGDALATYSVTTGRRGPQIAPFTADPARALASLDRIEGVPAAWVLPGHGDAWDRGADAAVRAVRERAAADRADRDRGAGASDPGSRT